MDTTLNIGFVAHVDAGKTSVTENILFLTGAKRKAGKVDDGTSTTDYLGVERRRGISVKASSVSVSYAERTINIIDAPGHADFVGEVERALAALDAAVVLVSAAEGVQPQTKVLFEAICSLHLPALFFINKTDLSGADAAQAYREISELSRKAGRAPILCNQADENLAIRENPALLDDVCEAVAERDEAFLERFLSGEADQGEVMDRFLSGTAEGAFSPVFCGSAKLSRGIEELLSFLARLPARRAEDGLCGFVYKVEHDKTLGRVAHTRLFGGTLKSRDAVYLPRLKKSVQITLLKRAQGGKLADVACAGAGDLVAICGADEMRAGDFIGKERRDGVPRIPFPQFMVKAECAEEKKGELYRIMTMLEAEEPALALEWAKGKRELTVRTTGRIHLETLKEQILDRFALDVTFSKPSVVYKETPTREGYGFVAYTMPKPCWAVVHLRIAPLPRGSGVRFSSVASDKQIKYKYQEHVRTSVFASLSQGLRGWEVTDADITLIGGEHHEQHTHPLDFFVATPMALMDGLLHCGSTLLEPYLTAELAVNTAHLDKVLSFLAQKRGRAEVRQIAGGRAYLTAVLPAEESFDLQSEFLSLTSGTGEYAARLSHYEPVPEGKGCDRERVGVNPLDRAKWILHARQAL